MLTFFCPNCWGVVEQEQTVCPKCGHSLQNLDADDFDTKLIAALRHSVPERRIMAAQILGNRGCKRALPEFQAILSGEETNYFILRSILLAVAKIEDPLRETILNQALHHPSALAAGLARDLLDALAENRPIDAWDRNTG